MILTRLGPLIVVVLVLVSPELTQHLFGYVTHFCGFYVYTHIDIYYIQVLVSIPWAKSVCWVHLFREVKLY
jgi:hypothetical protein